MRIRTLRDPPLPPLQFLVPGLIQKSALAVIAGPAGSGKSALVANLAVASAENGKWLGLPVSGGPVLWAAAEAAVSTEHRLRALGGRRAPIAIANDAPNLLDDGAFENFCVGLDEAAARLGAPISVLVVDALASSIRGGDENSSRDMTKAMGVLLRLAEECAVTVILIAHTGKAGDAHVRGHSSVIADATSLFTIEADKKGERHLRCMKQRDGEISSRIPFRIVVDGAALRAERVTCGGDVERTDQKRPSPDAKMMLSQLQEMGGQAEWDDLRTRCQSAFGERKAATMRQALSASKKSLLELGLITLEGESVSVSKTSGTVSRSVPTDGARASVQASA